MKNILKGFSIVIAVAAIVGVATWSQFSDKEDVVGNTFSSGSINLTVDGEEGAPITAKFTTENMRPGHEFEAGCVELKNTGSLPGILTVKVNNLVSNENDLIEPETSDGDTVGNEVDPTGYDANTGDGELWDQITTKMCMDSGAGSHATNNSCDWDDTIFKGFSSTQDDYSSTYSIKLDYDYADGKNIVLAPEQEETFCMAVKFIDDETNSWWGAQNGLTNNMAMTDDAQMDIEFGLKQVD